MAATHSVQAADMARWFSEIVKDEPAAKQLWFRQIGPISEIWLVADAEDVETERKLRSIGLELYEVFPDQRIDFEVINLALSASDASSYVPKDAESLVLH